jgi:hypothetical protein
MLCFETNAAAALLKTMSMTMMTPQSAAATVLPPPPLMLTNNVVRSVIFFRMFAMDLLFDRETSQSVRCSCGASAINADISLLMAHI